MPQLLSETSAALRGSRSLRRSKPGRVLRFPDAEPLDDLANRAAAALRQYVVEAPGSILVSHGAWIRAGLARITGDDVPRVLNGEVWILHAYEDDCGALGL